MSVVRVFGTNGSLSVSVHSRLIIPRQQFINPVDPLICDAGEDICQPRLGVNVVKLGGFHEGVDDGCRFATALGAHEHVFFATYGDAAHGPFGCVVVEFKEPVIQISAQPLHAGESITNGIGQGRLA
jgi:hypothetical protein